MILLPKVNNNCLVVGSETQAFYFRARHLHDSISCLNNWCILLSGLCSFPGPSTQDFLVTFLNYQSLTGLNTRNIKVVINSKPLCLETVRFQL